MNQEPDDFELDVIRSCETVCLHTSLSSSSSSNLDRRAIAGGDESDELSSSESSSNLGNYLRISIAVSNNNTRNMPHRECVTGTRWGPRTSSPVCWRHVYYDELIRLYWCIPKMMDCNFAIENKLDLCGERMSVVCKRSLCTSARGDILGIQGVCHTNRAWQNLCKSASAIVFILL